MLNDDRKARNAISRRIRQQIDGVVSEHFQRGTQEPAITAKIGDRLEQALNGKTINGYKVTVVAQDFSDRGKSSQESLTGADLLVGIRVQNAANGTDVSKGLLVQAKKASGTSNADQSRLTDQCRKLVKTSPKGAYVWIYNADGATAVPASEILAQNGASVQSLTTRTISKHFHDVFDCVAGDVELVSKEFFQGGAELDKAMRELSAKNAVAISLIKSP